uniref:Uncharacterized protein n=1 Tax=Odontella aurita TaxID=265563 RepID=A0A7S4JT03_9STRA
MNRDPLDIPSVPSSGSSHNPQTDPSIENRTRAFFRQGGERGTRYRRGVRYRAFQNLQPPPPRHSESEEAYRFYYEALPDSARRRFRTAVAAAPFSPPPAPSLARSVRSLRSFDDLPPPALASPSPPLRSSRRVSYWYAKSRPPGNERERRRRRENLSPNARAHTLLPARAPNGGTGNRGKQGEREGGE